MSNLIWQLLHDKAFMLFISGSLRLMKFPHKGQ
jgi:hypothetical protein